jgi:GT2 family glycosyltransferase
LTAEPPRRDGDPDAPCSPPPDLSIVVLTYNRERLLRDCLDSLLAQTYPAEGLEVLVANDGSSDGTSDLADGYARSHPHLRHLRHEHRGISATRNLGIGHARGALIAIVADDYLLEPTYAETVVRFFREHPEAAIVRFAVVPARRDLGSVISHTYYHASVLRRLGDSDHGPAGLSRLEPPGEITTKHRLDASGAAAFRRQVFERVGVFDETLARREDSDLTVRLRRHGFAVHYNPQHAVRHQYDPYLRDTLAKCWRTGWSGYAYYRKTPPGDDHLGGAASQLLRDKAAALFSMFRQARREKAAGRFLVALPFTLLFEAADKGGYICRWLWETCGRQARSRPPPTENERR